MPVRRFPDGSSERVPLAEDRAGYTATDADVAKIRAYLEGWEYVERPRIVIPDGWQTVRRGDQGNRTVVAASPLGTDRVVEVSYRYDADLNPTDHQVRAMPAEEAYQLFLDADEESRQRGFIVYDERHPRPSG